MWCSALGCHHQPLHGVLGFGARLCGATTSCLMVCSAFGCHHQMLHGQLSFGVPSPATSWAARLWGAITSCFMGCQALVLGCGVPSQAASRGA
ncbi:hypothetical protein NDU88_000239 [Pleurodeles waltl]|uniref:Uncharacterized protein n=1 Tax=Pleurodeles waltl TaxID=8319 RepID=A0AAV7MK88_PLEWA|nr:hypothetical protein NDU88_000239 [Pleurodeles waltl]